MISGRRRKDGPVGMAAKAILLSLGGEIEGREI